MLNSWQPNGQTLNGASAAASTDWEALAPQERQRVFVLDIGDLRVPISSAQATMRLAGQSFLQVIVPNGGEYIEPLEELNDEIMLLRTGYRFADGTLSPLEIIASAPFEQLRSDEGGINLGLTLSGYGTQPAPGSNTRTLQGVRYRSIGTQGQRRTRCDIDLFLRPGHTAIDSDGVSFEVGIIQYFINDAAEAMEVIQNG